MTATASVPAANTTTRADLAPWLIVALGLAIMYVPTFSNLISGIWGTDQQGHGPIVFGIACWLAWKKWRPMWEASENKSPSALGWPVFLTGLLLYVLGRSQAILLFEVGSLIWLLTGILLLTRGSSALKAQWFALFFMLFMVPLPGPVVDALTMPMKMAVSYVAESILYGAGYPIARSGVILQIGQYKLLVADACAGLHTLFTLEALGLLYLNIVRHDSLVRNVTLGILIVPISFSANVIRVMALTLITYYFGDEAGQGFLHGFAGMVLFVTALLLIIAVDSTLQALMRTGRSGRKHEESGTVGVRP
ncbi:exosortase B [Denitromonas ohlonensis]|uniref:Exosortase B n=2 Tax=Denitromonas TaxID=139331 RepID=A0A557RSH3_9RHOO|nr:exosortase B [Denitromonas ohlonensis]TVO68101.1 exosortase B [Denitromonas ohlonensis]TVO77994.1 exosortase B [Denitromonas ohlonensis]